jgi:hypothetical protein
VNKPPSHPALAVLQGEDRTPPYQGETILMFISLYITICPISLCNQYDIFLTIALSNNMQEKTENNPNQPKQKN